MMVQATCTKAARARKKINRILEDEDIRPDAAVADYCNGDCPVEGESAALVQATAEGTRARSSRTKVRRVLVDM